MEINNSTASLTTAANRLVESLQNQGARAFEAATDIVNRSANAANSVTANSPVEPTETRLQAETFLAAAAETAGTDHASTDIATPIVELKQAQRAFEASATALEVVNEVEDEILDILR